MAMCGRYAFTSPIEAVAGFFEASAAELAEVPANTNVCPSQNIVTLVSYQNQRRLAMMRWGFIPHWFKTQSDGTLLINARAETITEKPAFKSAVKNRRCIIPLNWYYEWSTKNADNKKIKYEIRQPDNDILGCAAIWQAWKDPLGHRLVTCAMITQPANKYISDYHHRMPVFLSGAQASEWLEGDGLTQGQLLAKTDDSIFDVKMSR